MEVRALGYVGVRSPNAEKWRTWGAEIMGFGMNDPTPATSALTQAAPVDGDAVYLRMDDRKWRLAVYPGKKDEIAFVGWELTDRLAFRDALRELDEKGVKYEVATELEALERGVQGMAWMRDPAGFRHEIFWSGYYLEDSFEPGRRPMKKGFRCGAEGIGHVVFMVSEFTQELDDFATGVLGMRLYAGGVSIPLTGGDGGRVRTEMYRGRRNLRSHNLVYMEKKGYHGLHHLFIEYDDLDDWGRTYDLVKHKSEFPLIMTMGRHQADTFLSFYAQTPSSFVCEIAWGSKQMDDEAFVQDRPLHSFVWGLDMVGPVIMDYLKVDETGQAADSFGSDLRPIAAE
jgi:2,3-dihydroxybiphenyl 1,2-dioxygenase